MCPPKHVRLAIILSCIKHCAPLCGNIFMVHRKREGEGEEGEREQRDEREERERRERENLMKINTIYTFKSVCYLS